MTPGMFPINLEPEIIEALNPTYPKVVQWQIKRKYGKHPAVIIDKIILRDPGLYGLLPKKKLSPWNTLLKRNIKNNSWRKLKCN